MTGFAGAQRVDERRRRRLATESDGVELEADKAAPERFPRQSVAGRLQFDPDKPLICPALDLVSAQAWKHSVAGLVVYLAGCAILAAGYHQVPLTAYLGRSLAGLFNLASGTVLNWFSQLLLFAAAEAALFVWWARARSVTDFAGSFRVWGWTAAVWLAFSFCLATGAHEAAAVRLAMIWPPRSAHGLMWYWLVPATSLGAWTGFLLQREMRGSRPSRRAALTSLTFFAAIVVWRFADLRIPSVEPRLMLVIEHAVLLAALVCGVLSMTLHVRHVLYETAEPPELLLVRKPGLWARLWTWLRSRREKAAAEEQPARRTRAKKGDGEATKTRKPRAPRKRAPVKRSAVAAASQQAEDSDIEQEDAAREASEDFDDEDELERLTAPVAATGSKTSASTAAASATTASANSGRKPAPVSEPAPVEAEDEEEDGEEQEGDWATEKAAAPRHGRQQQPAEDDQNSQSQWDEEQSEDDSDEENGEGMSEQPGRRFRVDGAAGPQGNHGGSANRDALKGLSKRERRKLQQQLRDQERAGRSG